MLHQQAAADQSSTQVAEASGPSSSSLSSLSFSSSSSSCSPACASSSSSSCPQGSQRAASRVIKAVRCTCTQRPLSFDLPAPQSVPGPAKSASNSASNASCITAEAGIPATAATATAAASTVISSVEATHESNKTSLSASSEAMHSDEEQAGLLVGSRGQDALGLPSSCAGCFSAWVETCAMTGLGLDALSTALLELADGHSLALTTFCMPSTAICTDSPCSRLCASHLGPFLFYTSHNADCPMRPLIPTIRLCMIVHCTLRHNFCSTNRSQVLATSACKE